MPATIPPRLPLKQTLFYESFHYPKLNNVIKISYIFPVIMKRAGQSTSRGPLTSIYDKVFPCSFFLLSDKQQYELSTLIDRNTEIMTRSIYWDSVFRFCFFPSDEEIRAPTRPGRVFYESKSMRGFADCWFLFFFLFRFPSSPQITRGRT